MQPKAAYVTSVFDVSKSSANPGGQFWMQSNSWPLSLFFDLFNSHFSDIKTASIKTNTTDNSKQNMMDKGSMILLLWFVKQQANDPQEQS